MAKWGDRPIGFVQIIDPVQEESEYQGNVPTNLRAIDIWNPYTILDEVDQHQAMAIAAGAEIVIDIQYRDYGDRDYSCQDPEGYLWNVGTSCTLEHPSTAQRDGLVQNSSVIQGKHHAS